MSFLRRLFGGSIRNDAVVDLVSLVQEELSSHGRFHILGVAPEDLVLRVRDCVNELEHELYLGNLQAELRDIPPEDRATRITGFVRGMLVVQEEHESWEAVQSHLFPVVRAMSALCMNRLPNQQ